MSKRDFRDEYGMKQTLRVRLDGVVIERSFRNKGEAIAYLQDKKGLRKDEIARRVKFS